MCSFFCTWFLIFKNLQSHSNYNIIINIGYFKWMKFVWQYPLDKMVRDVFFVSIWLCSLVHSLLLFILLVENAWIGCVCSVWFYGIGVLYFFGGRKCLACVVELIETILNVFMSVLFL